MGDTTRRIRIRAGLLLDGTGSPPLADGAVLIDGGRIEEVGPDALVSRPDHVESAEFPELTLMPGLVDCHSHLCLPGNGTSVEEAVAEGDDILLLRSAENARAALGCGVTSLRDNGASGRTSYSLKQGVAGRIIRGPRLSVCGRPLTTTGGHCWPFGGEADGVEGVRLATRQLLKEGADYIKVMATGGSTRNTSPYRTSYTLPELRAIVDEARTGDRLTAAHALCTEGIVNALDAGFDMIVHCSFHDPDGSYRFREDIARRMADSGVWVNPTLHVSRARIWRLEKMEQKRDLTPEERTQLEGERHSYELRCDNFQRLLAAGVRMAAGSDSGWSHYPFGGFAHEVEAMAAAGMGVAAAIQSCTLDSARSMGIDGKVGSMEVGKLADLLLIDGDPTVDIFTLGRVVAVHLGGERVI